MDIAIQLIAPSLRLLGDARAVLLGY